MAHRHDVQAFNKGGRALSYGNKDVVAESKQGNLKGVSATAATGPGANIKKKDGGKVIGKAAGGRLDKRARGGVVKKNVGGAVSKSPFSSAHPSKGG